MKIGLNGDWVLRKRVFFVPRIYANGTWKSRHKPVHNCDAVWLFWYFSWRYSTITGKDYPSCACDNVKCPCYCYSGGMNDEGVCQNVCIEGVCIKHGKKCKGVRV